MKTLRQAQGKPFTVLAPMANVTDSAFRQIVLKCGQPASARPDVFYTEFLSCDGIVYDRTKFAGELYFEKNERPLVVQFFGSKPDNFYKCAQLAQELGFDGIDINMGCPDRSIEKQGGGAALIKTPKLAKEIIKETMRGAGQLPVSVKTRLGYNKNEIKEWIPNILETEPAAITIHGRTRKEMSAVPADWDAIGKAGEIIKTTKTLVIGNGDIKDLEDGFKKAKDYNLDGIMVGRGIFNNPWFFNKDKKIEEITKEERIALMIEHIQLFKKLWGGPPAGGKNFDTMKKFFKIYVSGWPGAKELRIKLMAAKNDKEVLDILG